MLIIALVAIQHAQSSDRWHPVIFRDAPLPGPGPHPVRRLKSYGHHTEGFATHEEAIAECERICLARMFSQDGFPVHEVDEPGADVLIERATC